MKYILLYSTPESKEHLIFNSVEEMKKYINIKLEAGYDFDVIICGEFRELKIKEVKVVKNIDLHY